MSQPSDQHRDLLARVARDAMIEYGLEPEFPARAMAEACSATMVVSSGLPTRSMSSM